MGTSLREFKNALDKYLEAAEMEPVIIEMSRRKKFVLISYYPLTEPWSNAVII